MSGLQPAALSTHTQAHKRRERGREAWDPRKDKGRRGGARRQRGRRSGATGRATRPQGCREGGRNARREGRNDRQGQAHRAGQGRRRRQMRGQRDGWGERGKAQSREAGTRTARGGGGGAGELGVTCPLRASPALRSHFSILTCPEQRATQSASSRVGRCGFKSRLQPGPPLHDRGWVTSLPGPHLERGANMTPRPVAVERTTQVSTCAPPHPAPHWLCTAVSV